MAELETTKEKAIEQQIELVSSCVGSRSGRDGQTVCFHQIMVAYQHFNNKIP